MVMEIKNLAERFAIKYPKIAASLQATAKIAREIGVPEKFPQPEDSILFPEYITVGSSGRELEELVSSIRGLRVRDWARDIISKAPVDRNPRISQLAVLDVQQTIIEGMLTTGQVWREAQKSEGEISAEQFIRGVVIPAAEGKIKVEIGKLLVAVMKPITDSRGVLSVLYVERRVDGLWLDASYADLAGQWRPDCRFVVSSRK